MMQSLRTLALGFGLIALAAGILLYGDRGARHRAAKQATAHKPRVALIVPNSQSTLEDAQAGFLAALAEGGWRAGVEYELELRNAQGDAGALALIAREATAGRHDLVATLTTNALIGVARANEQGARTRHVFGQVVDPWSAGVGLEKGAPPVQPAWMTGVASPPPVADTLRLARRLRPELARVGLVWNAGEANSRHQTATARATCAELGIELLEADASNSVEVGEAAASLVSRGAQALLLSGDLTAIVAFDALLGAARRGGIPVLSCIPPMTERGALYDLGCDYVDVGREAGKLAVRVLAGERPGDIAVHEYAPQELRLNLAALEGLKERWDVPADVQAQATLVVARDGTRSGPRAMKPATTTAAPAKKRIAIAYFGPEQTVDECIEGLLGGLKAAGYEEGRNLEVRKSHAQGEIVNIGPMLQALDAEGYDALVTLSTPVLASACGVVKRTKVVLTYCFDPVAAGAGKSLEDHLPFLTGIGSSPPLERLVAALRELQPRPKKVGVVYNASEANSSRRVAQARSLLEGTGIALDAATIGASSEVLLAAQALVARGVDAFWAVGDNTAVQAIDALMKVARDARVPVLADDPTHVDRGAVAGLGVAFHEVGKRTAPILTRVLRGEDPARIPIDQIMVLDVAVDPAAARQLGVALPESLLREANRGPYVRVPRPPKKRVVDVVLYTENPTVEQALAGVRAGFRDEGWLAEDWELRVRQAQGDIAALSSIADACSQGDADLVLPLTTPATQAMLRRVRGKPIVYGLVADGVVAGAGRTASDHEPFVTGVDVPAPTQEGLDLLLRCLPRAKRLGTLYAPGEVNSVLYKDQLDAACRARGIELVAVGVNSPSEIADAALALCGRGIDAVAQIIDNCSAGGFPSIAAAAERARLPAMSWSSSAIHNGAFLTVSRDFERNGADTARLAMRVLAGEDPARIPFGRTLETSVQVDLARARQFGIEVPQDVRKQAKIVDEGGR